jgi:hypothetical protein
MDSLTLRAFQDEIDTQCKLVLIGAEQLDWALKRVPRFDQDETAYVWYAIQGILVSSANISKCCWGAPFGGRPARERVERERTPLRRYLHVTNKSALRNRVVRNAFEHIDEPLATLRSGDRYVGRNIGPPTAFPRGTTKRFAHFNPGTGWVTIWGGRVKLDPLIREVARVYGIAAVEPS